MKVLAVSVFDIFNHSLEKHFDLTRQHTTGIHYDPLHEYYYVNVNDELATELMLKDIGKIKEVTLTDI